MNYKFIARFLSLLLCLSIPSGNGCHLGHDPHLLFQGYIRSCHQSKAAITSEFRASIMEMVLYESKVDSCEPDAKEYHNYPHGWMTQYKEYRYSSILLL